MAADPLRAESSHRTARKLKYPDRINATWTERVLGRDEHGEWSVLPAGSPVRRASGTILRYATDQVFCYPYDRWWVARMGAPPVGFRAYRADGSVRTFDDVEPERADISTPAEMSADGISFVDLTLDVVRDRHGVVTVLDEDEVAEEVARYAIPAGHVQAAQRSCADVAALMRAGAPPFDGSATRWLAVAADLSLR
ncbi:DUF402 domain-containing protein [Actinopolymorpha sp. NPDC004070]|uniref:DUF402 domain-containing protein n=1 Tax=Actinopolymorpha sp. NPDC004070 TaxID=3154548 RepID=UPI0033B19689